jgi:hypothetical protein
MFVANALHISSKISKRLFKRKLNKGKVVKE